MDRKMSSCSDGGKPQPKWCNHSGSIKQRGKTFRNIMKSKNIGRLVVILASGWDVNEFLPKERKINEGAHSLNRIDDSEGGDDSDNDEDDEDDTDNEINLSQMCIRTEYNWHTALHTSIMNGWMEGVEMLIQADADVNLQESQGVPNSQFKYTPLMKAILQNRFKHQKSRQDIIFYLLEHGADPHLRCPITNHSAILVACKTMNLPVIKELMENHKVEINITSIPWVPASCSGAYIPFLEMTPLIGILKNCLNPNSDFHANREYGIFPPEYDPGPIRQNETEIGDTWLRVCAENQKYNLPIAVRLVQDLIDYGANVNMHGGGVPPIYLCVSGIRFIPEVLDILYNEGANLEKQIDGSTAIHLRRKRINTATAVGFCISANAHINNLRWLIRHGANTNIEMNNNTILQLALAEDNYHAVELLVASGVTLPEKLYETIDTRLFQLERPHLRRESALRAPSSDKANDGSVVSSHNISSLDTNQRTTKSKQAHDWLEINDVHEDTYPQIAPVHAAFRWMDKDKKDLQHLRRVHKLLSVPQTLAWWARHSLRQNLISLSPSLIRILPIPTSIKRYILCYEV